MITKINIPCVWGGQLAGILLKNHAASTVQTTKKILGIHGWLDNLNSLLPLAEKLIDRHPNYEICLYDRAGHGFSSHLPQGSDYSYAYNLRDVRIVTQALGWNKEKFSFLAHSYGGVLAMTYAAAYPEEVECLVTLDSMVRSEKLSRPFWETAASRIDRSLKHHSKSAKKRQGELTFEKAVELVKSSRLGIDDQSAKLLVERSVRRDQNNQLCFTRDEALKNMALIPFSADMAEEVIRNVRASVLFVGTVNPQWPTPESFFQLLKEHNPNFERTLIDGPHHFHMTQVDRVFEPIERYLDKYLK